MRPEPRPEDIDPVENFKAERELVPEDGFAQTDAGMARESSAEPWNEPAADMVVAENWTPPDLYCAYEPAFPQLLPRLIPNLGHVVLFFVMAVVLLGVGQVLGVLVIAHSHLFGHRSIDALMHLSAEDARLSIPIQAFSYGLIVLVAVPVFSLLWNQPFSEGVHWKADTAKRRFVALALLGLAAGIGINLFGGFLPMPKEPPIVQGMMKSPLGAWMMLIFGVTAAPLTEELAFRGFLLPGLMNCFRWLARKGSISESTVRRVGIPVSILLTSLGFALMHSPQLSHAWGPLLLIGMVSVVLCIVRLTTDSVAAGAVVHAAYNFTLFAAMLAQTGGFRHLEKLGA